MQDTLLRRPHNFSAGPAVLPLSVLEKAQKDFLNFNNSGMSIMEISHRTKPFEAVLAKTKSKIRALLNIPENYELLFLQGGASLQFSMVPMNLAISGKSVDLINTGVWSKKALKEIKKVSPVRILASSEADNFTYIPTVRSEDFDQNASFAHITSNNTIYGTQWTQFPISGNLPLVADMSSDIMSKPFDVSQFGLIYAGAQKNIGPSGVTLVIIRKDLAERASSDLPSMLLYRNHIENDSLFNTPNTFGIYMMMLMMEHFEEEGGLSEIQKRNEEKAELLYQTIDDSNFYGCPVKKEDRSLMNIVFRIRGNNEALETKFVQESKERHFEGLKGHRSVGGLRASTYNALPLESIKALTKFMKEFEQANR